jgi:exopolysaccharide biosynthesis predicted pyruvyltransferase EpsI
MSATVPSATLIEEIQRSIERALDGLTSGAGPFALLDFPNYPNVGDSAIWLGALEYFRRLSNRQPAYVCSKRSIDWQELERTVPDGPIFIQGGGNFGDLWPGHQTFRESIIERYPNRMIVQLPQSIHFESNETLDRTRRIINKHGNFHLLVRDRQSHELAAKAFTCPVHLCSDLAFLLGPLARPAHPIHERVFLLRTDKEAATSESTMPALPDTCAMFDWTKDAFGLPSRTKWQVAIQSLWPPNTRQLSRQELRAIYYRRLAEARLSRGLKLLASGKSVVTDRLHGHILCVLLAIPHVVIDNSYGKLGSFIDTWTAKCDLLGLSHSPLDAMQSIAAFDDWRLARHLHARDPRLDTTSQPL